MKYLANISLLFIAINCKAQSKNDSTLIIQNKQMEVVIYPNPAIDNCIIKVEEGSCCSLISSSGTIIGTWNVDYSNTLYLSDLKSGIFQLLIEKDTLRVIKKIVVL